MKTRTSAQVLTIYIGDEDRWQNGLLYATLVTKLKEIGVAGVTVLHGMEGFGANGKLHTQRFEVLFQGLPVIVQAVDTPEHIEAALSLLDSLLTEALVTVHDVSAIRYNVNRD